MEIEVNGRRKSVAAAAGRSLLDILRDDLGLTGAKAGCGIGACGACTVLVEGQPVRACRLAAAEAAGARVETVEGLAGPGGALHPLQEEFLRAGAVGCGYCTPGMLMASLSLLRRRPEPAADEVRAALAPQLCRCTGYLPIVEAVLAAAARLAGAPAAAGEPGRVGRSPFRIDGIDKVTGRTRFTADLPLPEGTLHAAAARSPVAHGELTGLDPGPALAVPGVQRVLRAADLGELHDYGKAIADQPALASGRLRWRGNALAIVVADTAEAARLGAAALRPRVRELPAVLDPERALAPEAPALHPAGNLAARFRVARGDLTRAFGEARRVFEHVCRTPFVEHALLETEAALVEPLPDGTIRVTAPTQNVFFDQATLGRILGLPGRERDRIQVVQAPTGAAFGKREDLSAQIPALLAGRALGRPMRVVYDRAESHLATTKRHPMRIAARTAWDAQGRLLGFRADILAETGAYASWAPNVIRKAALHAPGPYRTTAVEVEARAVYTNRAVAGAMRGYGATQAILAAELAIDQAAAEMGLDPLEIRRRNGLRPGDLLACGQALPGGGGLAPVLEAAAADFGWPGPRRGARRPDGRRSGVGLAGAFYGIGYGAGLPDHGQAEIELTLDGVFEIRTGAIDYGQGAATVFAQIAAEILGADLAALRVAVPDTARTPDSGSTVASRQTRVTGAAVAEAARELAAGLAWLAPGPRPPAGGWAELAAALESAGRPRTARGRTLARTSALDPAAGQGEAYASYAFAACCAEVALDPETGQVRVERMAVAHDSGRIIHPALARAQVAGGVAMGIGLALFEEYRVADGDPLDLNLDTYRLVRAPDMPELSIRFVESYPDSGGPFGATGLGEPATLAVAPAVVNAVADAAGGAWPEALPLTPERVRGLIAGA